MGIERQDFVFVQELVRQRAGIVVDDSKQYLVDSRLELLAKSLGQASVSELIAEARSPHDCEVCDKIVDAMTTNETSFMRDQYPFQFLQKIVVPEFLGKRKGEGQLKIWCAASSTGQEPYSIAMILRDSFPELRKWGVQIVASDISTQALERCQEAHYTDFEIMRGLPEEMRTKYCRREGQGWTVVDEVREMVDFRQINLLAPLPSLPQFDVVFLRNVLIYFDVPVKARVLEQVSGVMRDDGMLFLGGGETLMSVPTNFQRVALGRLLFYRKG